MRQLALDLIAEAQPSFDNFVAGPNTEALAALRMVAAGRSPVSRVHLWGEPASGKTHLLRALAGTPVGPESPIEAFSPSAEAATQVIAVDDCERLDDTRQLALFRLFNQRAGPGEAPIVTASRHAPMALAELRPELRTRLGSGLVLALRPLTDQEREQALREAARATGVHAHSDVFHYLLTRKARDLRTLLAFFTALDRYALERQRPLSAALAREFDALIDAPVEPLAAPRPIAGPGEPG